MSDATTSTEDNNGNTVDNGDKDKHHDVYNHPPEFTLDEADGDGLVNGTPTKSTKDSTDKTDNVPNDKATNTFNRHVDQSLVGDPSTGKRGTVWVQVLVGSHKIGQPSEFVAPRNVDALKKDVKEEYVELQETSAACFQVFHSSVTVSGCAVPLAANSVVPLMAIHDDPIKVVAPVPKQSAAAHAPILAPVSSSASAPAASSQDTLKRGRGRPRKSLTSTLTIEQYKAAMASVAQPTVRAPAPAPAPVAAPAASQNAVELAAQAAFLQHPPLAATGAPAPYVPAVPNRPYVPAVPKNPSAGRKRAAAVTEEDVAIATTTGHEHDTMRSRGTTSRRCIVCMRKTANECTHEDCQARIKTLGAGKELYGVPLCGSHCPPRTDTNKYGPFNTKTCLELHVEKVQSES